MRIVFFTPRISEMPPPLSHVPKLERNGTRSVEICEAIFPRERGRHLNLSGLSKYVLVSSERRDGTADELRALRVLEVERAGGQHRFRSHDTGIHRNHGHFVRSEVERHVRGQL